MYMCGIVLYIGSSIAFDILFEGLSILQNRGYDSAGICTINNNEFIIHKFASTESKSALQLLKDTKNYHNNKVGIAHTRWATHGPKTDYNSHPHIDFTNNIAVVHNGIIENYKELKQMLLRENFSFKSDTDTEVIANLIGFYLKDNIDDAIFKAISKLEGTWGLGILYRKTPDIIYLAKHGSPLLIGIHETMTIVASEPSAFSNYTNKYITVDDGDIIKISNNVIEKLNDSSELNNVKIYEGEKILLSPDPYPHWTIKEIMDQPESIMRAFNNGGRILDDYHVRLGGLNKELIKNIDNLIILGCGTSLNAGMLGQKYIKYLGCFNTVQVIDAAEFTVDDIPRLNAGFIVMSQSGETKDVHRAMSLIKNYPIIGVVNVVGSLIARDTDCGIYVNAGREVAVASTKSFTSQVLILALVAIWVAQYKNINKEKRKQFIYEIKNISKNIVETLKTKDLCKKIANDLKNKPYCFILGRGFAEPISREGALKLKEISYINAQGYPGGSLKHGPFALIEKGTPIILISLNGVSNKNVIMMESAAEEVGARGAYNILITDTKVDELKRNLYEEIIYIPHSKLLGPILSIIPLQLIAYEMSIAKGINPDYPRNLAKVVTVDG